MAQSEQQRQRKLAKKQSKTREKHKQIARMQQNLASMAGKMQASSKGEIIYCGICSTITDVGIGHVVIARQGPSRLVGLAMFLVDIGCLGVKDTMACLRGPSEVKAIIEKLENRNDLQPVAPELARGLVEAAVGYAKSLGFEPHSDYRKASMIWGDIQAQSIEGHYEFGRNGKPHYCNGPFEDIARQEAILCTLERSVGKGNFHFTMAIDPNNEDMLEHFIDGDSSIVEGDEGSVRRLDEPHA